VAIRMTNRDYRDPSPASSARRERRVDPVEKPFQHGMKFQIWAPFGFCCFLVVGGMLFPGGKNTSFGWLPMCFFGVATVPLSFLRRIRALEAAQRGESRDSSATIANVE
jgi:hypothetical protein